MNKSEQVQTYLKQQSGLFGRELFLKDIESFKKSFNSYTGNKKSVNKLNWRLEKNSLKAIISSAIKYHKNVL